MSCFLYTLAFVAVTSTLLNSSVKAFTVGALVPFTPCTTTSSSSSTQLDALTAKDILARARQAVGRADEDDESPKLFDDELLDDMQKSLLVLEKRVKQGPRSLSQTEIQNLEDMLGRIVNEMESFLENGGNAVSNSANKNTKVIAPAASTVTSSYPTNASKDDLSPLVTPRNAAPGGEAKPLLENLPAALGPRDVEYNSEEGEQYTGVGGLGLAKGTTNTYVIPGMDEMTGEEYRAALQRSVSDRQARRRQSGMVGNRSSQNYLDNL